MGRAKLPIKLINPVRSRNATFTKRTKGLKKKMFEFSTLCDVDACLVVYGSGPMSAPETWPEDPAEVRRIIDRFEKEPAEERDKRKHDVSSFLRSKNKKMQDELDQRRVENADLASMLLWNQSSSNSMDPDTIHELWFRLTSKINAVDQRIETKKKNDNGQQYEHDQLDPNPENTSEYLHCLCSVAAQGSHGNNSFAFNEHEHNIHEVGALATGLGNDYSDPIPMFPYGTQEGIPSIIGSHDNSSFALNEQDYSMVNACTYGTGTGRHTSDPISLFPYGYQEGVPFITDGIMDVKDNNLPANLSYAPPMRSKILPSIHVPSRRRTEPIPLPGRSNRPN